MYITWVYIYTHAYVCLYMRHVSEHISSSLNVIYSLTSPLACSVFILSKNPESRTLD